MANALLLYYEVTIARLCCSSLHQKKKKKKTTVSEIRKLEDCFKAQEMHLGDSHQRITFNYI